MEYENRSFYNQELLLQLLACYYFKHRQHFEAGVLRGLGVRHRFVDFMVLDLEKKYQELIGRFLVEEGFLWVVDFWFIYNLQTNREQFSLLFIENIQQIKRQGKLDSTQIALHLDLNEQKSYINTIEGDLAKFEYYQKLLGVVRPSQLFQEHKIQYRNLLIRFGKIIEIQDFIE